jgi:Ca2+-binding RTX toxin-like protein
MSAPLTPTTQQSFDLSYWAYSQAGTPYVDGPTQLPDGFTYLMSGGAPVIDYNQYTGFYGAALVSATGQVVVAFEGTNVFTANTIFTAAQSFDDFCITYGLLAPSYFSADAFTQTAIADAEAAGYSAADVSLTGHSLGGADAEYVGQQTGLAGTTFGAPGIPTADTPYGGANFVDYVDRGDPVGSYAPDGYEVPLLKAQTIAHYGQALYVGPYTNAALLIAASIAYEAAQASTSPSYAAAEYAASATSVALAASLYHPLGNYAVDLDLTVPGASGGLSATQTGGAGGEDLSTGVSAGQAGGIDIPGLDITSAGALQVTGSTVTVSSEGQSYSLDLPAGHETFSLSSDGQGGTLVTPDAASSGYVFAGSNGATVQGGSAPLYFVGGSGPVSVTGGSGDTTLFGGTGATVFQGGSGTNVLYGGVGASTLIAGTGASTLIGGSGTMQAFAEGAAPVVLINGSGASTINGTTGSGSETVFTGSGQSVIALDGAADTVVGGSGAASVIGGSGADVYGFIDGHAGGSEIIAGLKDTDVIAFGGYASDPITSEGVLRGSDILTLADGTTILLQGIDHKVFNGLA